MTLRHALALGIGIGGLLSANSTVAQVECTLSFDQNAQIDLANLSQTLADCADDQTPLVWSELVDRGSYEFVYSAPENSNDRRITGISHVDWKQGIPLEIGTLFGFRAKMLIDGDAADENFQIITYPPDGPDGPRAPETTTKPLTAGATEAALFLIGSEDLLIPGEWRIALRYRGQVLVSQRFDLTPPPDE